MGRERVVLVSKGRPGSWLLSLTLLSGALLSGCADNQAACRGYYQALQNARTECGIAADDPENPLPDEDVMCPASLNHGGDCIDHYLTLRDAVSCDTEKQEVVGAERTQGCF